MRQAKKPETKERQNASTPPSKWTCPREQTPATANTSYAVPQRRSRSRLAGSPKPPMESRQAHSIHGVALSRASSRSRCATGSIPTPRCRARPARNAAQIRPQRRRARATPPMAPSMRPIRVPKKQKYAQNCNFFAKRIVVTEQFLRKTRVPSMPIKPSSSTEPQGIDHASTHAITLGKDPALARPKNATSEEKRWAK